MEENRVPVSLSSVRRVIIDMQKMIMDKIRMNAQKPDPDSSLFDMPLKEKRNCKLYGYKNAKGSIHKQDTIDRQLSED